MTREQVQILPHARCSSCQESISATRDQTGTRSAPLTQAAEGFEPWRGPRAPYHPATESSWAQFLPDHVPRLTEYIWTLNTKYHRFRAYDHSASYHASNFAAWSDQSLPRAGKTSLPTAARRSDELCSVDPPRFHRFRSAFPVTAPVAHRLFLHHETCRMSALTSCAAVRAPALSSLSNVDVRSVAFRQTSTAVARRRRNYAAAGCARSRMFIAGRQIRHCRRVVSDRPGEGRRPGRWCRRWPSPPR